MEDSTQASAVESQGSGESPAKAKPKFWVTSPSEASDAAPSATSARESMVQCCFGCGTMGPSHAFANIGNRTSMRYCCRPCQASRAMLDRELKKLSLQDAETAAAIKAQRVRDPKWFDMQIRMARLSPGDGTSGAVDVAERGQRRSTFTAFFSEKVKVAFTCACDWLLKNEYLTRAMSDDKFLTAEAAAEQWRALEVNPLLEPMHDVKGKRLHTRFHRVQVARIHANLNAQCRHVWS
jgi:hypothetical protein